MADTDDRIALLERVVARLCVRVGQLEQRTGTTVVGAAPQDPEQAKLLQEPAR
jgi:hypothetical protein